MGKRKDGRASLQQNGPWSKPLLTGSYWEWVPSVHGARPDFSASSAPFAVRGQKGVDAPGELLFLCLMAPAPRGQSWNWMARMLQPTRWSLVNRLRGPGPDRQVHADMFCRVYWYPLYSFLRSSGYNEQDAQDYVQSFLSTAIEENLLAAADPSRGRLRNFLMTLLERHVSAERVRAGALKRGGGMLRLPLDWTIAEAAWRENGRSAATPEQSYRRALAERLVEAGIAALRERYEATGNATLLEELLPALEGALAEETYAAIGARLGMKPNAVSVAVLRMRQRFRKEVQTTAAALIGIPPGPLLDSELRDLFCGPDQHASVS